MPLKVYPGDVPFKDRRPYDSLPNVPYSQHKMATKAKADGREPNNNEGKDGKQDKKEKDTGETTVYMRQEYRWDKYKTRVQMRQMYIRHWYR